MTTLEKVEKEIKSLSQKDFFKLLEWLDHYKEDAWDKQIARDSKSGRLDFLFKEVSEERKKRQLKTWPARK